MNQYLAALLFQLGITSGEDVRGDSAATAIIEKQLETVKSRTYDVIYAKLKARDFIPVSHEGGEGAETIVYYQWDEIGMAKIISNYADDLPMVDAFRKEFKRDVISIGDGYQYSIQDLRRSAKSGANLDQHRARVARLVVERKIEQLASVGDTAVGMPGFVNHPNVPTVTLPTGTWGTATAAQIVADLNYMAQSIVTTTKDSHEPNVLLMDTASYALINQKMMSTTGDTGITVLKSFLENNPYITRIEQWTVLDTADGAGTGPRLVMYQLDPMVLELEIPQEFEQFPPQARNLAFIVPCHARVGGTVIRYPLAIAYADNHL